MIVNGLPRSVASVSISGAKVLLTLSSAVEYGNTVTVAYNRPYSNSLQTPAGARASSISAQPVTNKVADVPDYLSAVIENSGPSVLTVTFSLSLASTIVPAPSSFSVLVNSAARTVSSVSISGNLVYLFLSAPVSSTDVVTLAYTQPATNPLQTTAGGKVVTFSAKPVTNSVAPVPVYTGSAVEDATPSIITMIYSLPLSSSYVPAPGAFTVKVNTVSRTVSSVSVSGTNVLLTLGTAVTNGDVVTVAYTKPGTNPLQTSLGGLAATIAAQTVTNNVLPAPPEYITSAIENAAPSVLVMTYNTTLEATIIPAASVFRVTVNGLARVVNSVAISGTNVLLTLSSPVFSVDVVTVSYTKPASNPLQTPAAIEAASLSAQPVTNNVVTVIPVYVSSVIEDAAPYLLAMTYNNTLVSVAPDRSAFTVKVNSVSVAINAVAITGFRVLLTLASPVVYGDVVKVSYTKPSLNPLQTSTGGQAVTISDQLVTNNVNSLIPGYLSSVIEDIKPDLLIMTYTLSLADVVPSSSAFTVTVNSATRNVIAVAIVNGKVQLTLESAILNGDLVTVSYSKPSVNPLQTASGEQAVSISAQLVSNNVGTVNIPPDVVMNYEETVFSGFIGGLDASGTYDQNNDNLTFEWIVPSTVPVSSTNSSKIRFLAPILKTSETIEFTLNVSDGKSVQSKSVQVLIQPYQPELGTLPVMKIESDGYIGTDVPANVLDGNQGTWWSSQGEEHWLVKGLTNPSLITYLILSFPESPVNSYYFDVYASADNISWDPVLINAVSCMFSGDAQVFEFPLFNREIPYSYVKLLVHGNSGNDINYISEFRAYGIQEVSFEVPGIEMNLFPNPANNYFNLLLTEEPPTPYLIKIINMNGMVVFEKTIESAETYVSLPVSIRSGAYIVQLSSGYTILGVNRLVIHELRTN